MDQDTRNRFQFFREHAGYSVPPGRLPCALALAHAEQWAEERDAETIIEPDWDIDVTATDEQMERISSGKTRMVWMRLEIADETVASLGGIEVVSESDPYLRIVAAELADEARYEIEREERERAECAARDIATV